ncbi:MAG: hypothetical protein WAN36_07560, partial [Calditrichia bacterium]
MGSRISDIFNQVSYRYRRKPMIKNAGVNPWNCPGIQTCCCFVKKLFVITDDVPVKVNRIKDKVFPVFVPFFHFKIEQLPGTSPGCPTPNCIIAREEV